MKICLLGLDNLPVLAPEYREHTVGGESVQQTLLARALARYSMGACRLLEFSLPPLRSHYLAVLRKDR